MLTEQQLKKLNPLLTNAKYGNILQNAIEIWKTEVNPTVSAFGLLFSNSNKWKSVGQCCLVGASLVDKTIIGDNYYESMEKFYKISKKEYESLWKGFDSNSIPTTSDEAFEFGHKVRLAIWPE